MAALALHHDQPPVSDLAHPQTAGPGPRGGAARPAACPRPSPGPGACAARRPAGPPPPQTTSSARCGTRTSRAMRDLTVPPWRRVIRPRGTGLTRAGVSPARPGRHTGPTPTTGGGRTAHRFLPPTPPAAAVADNTKPKENRNGKIVISENVSLDGVVQDPAGDEGFRHGGWIGRIGDGAAKRRPRSRSTRRWAPRPCCWAGAATSSSPRGGHPGPASWRTG